MKTFQQALLVTIFAICKSATAASDSEMPVQRPEPDSVLPHSLEAKEIVDSAGEFAGCGVKFTLFGHDDSQGLGGNVMVRGALGAFLAGEAFGMVFQVLPFDLVDLELAAGGGQATAKVFEVSSAYLKTPFGIALPDKQSFDDCGIVELEEHGYCRVIQDDYTNPVIGAMMQGVFSIIYMREADGSETEVSVEPQYVENHPQYLAEMSGCMNKTMQMLREKGYGD